MENGLQIKFGLRCKDLRSKAGYSQERFANLIDMDRSYQASIEVGRRNVTLSSMKKIADGLEMNLSELLEEVD